MGLKFRGSVDTRSKKGSLIGALGFWGHYKGYDAAYATGATIRAAVRITLTLGLAWFSGLQVWGLGFFRALPGFGAFLLLRSLATYAF